MIRPVINYTVRWIRRVVAKEKKKKKLFNLLPSETVKRFIVFLWKRLTCYILGYNIINSYRP